MHHDVFYQLSTSQAHLMNNTSTTNNWQTGITSDFRSYIPSNSKYKDVAAIRSSTFNPQKSFSNIFESGRYSSYANWFANSSALADGGNRISYLAPAGSRPNNYYWVQHYNYTNPTKALFSNQQVQGLAFYRLSDGNNVIVDQLLNDNQHWLFYNAATLDNNLLTLSNAGAVSKIESSTMWQDNTTTPTTPLLFQTHGGIGSNNGGAMATDYARDSFWTNVDRETYIYYHPNFGSNTNISADIEIESGWQSNMTGGRSGRWRDVQILISFSLFISSIKLFDFIIFYT